MPRPWVSTRMRHINKAYDASGWSSLRQFLGGARLPCTLDATTVRPAANEGTRGHRLTGEGTGEGMHDGAGAGEARRRSAWAINAGEADDMPVVDAPCCRAAACALTTTSDGGTRGPKGASMVIVPR